MKKHDWQKKIVVNYRERQESCPGREGGRDGLMDGGMDQRWEEAPWLDPNRPHLVFACI